MNRKPSTNSHLNQELEVLGCSVVPLFSAGECTDFLELFERRSLKTGSGITCTMLSQCGNEQWSVDSGPKWMLKRKLERLFLEHQDSTYVDETVSNSFARWIPLVELKNQTRQLCKVHFSYPSLSDQTRVAATVILGRDMVEMFHFWKSSSERKSSVKQLSDDSEFFLRIDIFKHLGGIDLIGIHQDEFPDVSEYTLKTCFENAR